MVSDLDYLRQKFAVDTCSGKTSMRLKIHAGEA